uniref:Uncharacterized protein n=1 Tax=Cacopsylla melanoneura TaxID=428564 RepID=A0A8D8WNQ9_9HEMI
MSVSSACTFKSTARNVHLPTRAASTLPTWTRYTSSGRDNTGRPSTTRSCSAIWTTSNRWVIPWPTFGRVPPARVTITFSTAIQSSRKSPSQRNCKTGIGKCSRKDLMRRSLSISRIFSSKPWRITWCRCPSYLTLRATSGPISWRRVSRSWTRRRRSRRRKRLWRPRRLQIPRFSPKTTRERVSRVKRKVRRRSNQSRNPSLVSASLPRRKAPGAMTSRRKYSPQWRSTRRCSS